MGKNRAKPRAAVVVPLFRQPSDAARLFIRASQLDADRGMWPVAERLYAEVVRLAPGHVEAWNNLGVMHYNQRRREAALEAWDAALELDPRRSETLNNVGHLLQCEGKLEAACVYLLRAVENDPEMAEARVNLALVLQGLGRTRAALRHWRAYLVRWPRGEFSELARKHEGLCSEAGRR